MIHPIARCILLAAACLAATTASAQEPVSVLAKRIGGHIHPSICQTPKGTLVVVFKGEGGLVVSRSTDLGATWSEPALIPTTPKRPDVIREVKRFEVYPGTADTLPDGRILVTWNYIADDKATDGYYERALLYTISEDDGLTWSEQALIGPVDGHHLGAIRHNVLPWTDGRWLLPLRVGPPRLYDPKTGELEVFSLLAPDGKQYPYKQIVRTAKDTLVAMGPKLLRSTDNGKTWTEVEDFPADPAKFPSEPLSDTEEGRYLTVLKDGGLLVGWGLGRANKGIRYNYSADDGQTWSDTLTLLPDTPVTARYYSVRTIQIDDDHVGSVFMNSNGVHFLKVPLTEFTK